MTSKVVRRSTLRQQRGTTLAELMIALVVLAVGILAVAQLFPAGSRGQVQDRLMSTANYYAQQQIEEVMHLPWSDTRLTVGRHPVSASNDDDLGAWRRHYEVEVLAAPLDNLKKVVVTVTWNFQGARSVHTTTYIRR
jgi:prepilin-type N-terminal cleavage/methylation domain-containing protein